MKYFFLLISICISQQFYAQQSKSFSVFFENNSAQLSKQSTQVLETILLNKDSIASVKIFGYTNDIGKDERNNLLSVERANIVYEYFKQNGLKISKLARPDGKGKIDLISDAPTTILEQRRNNRKTDIIISYIFTKQKPLEKLVENVKKTPEPSLENLSELSVGNKIILKNVLFEGSRAVLFKDSYTELKRLVTLLKENNKINILVIGHICCQYDNRDAFDIDTGIKNLSKARANTIKEYLIDNGIAPERIKTKGAKGMSPLGGSVEFDRRVEIEIIS